MMILKRYRCKFSRQKHMCSSFNCTWHVYRYFLNNAWRNTNMTYWSRIFVDKLNIVYSKREDDDVEKLKKRRSRERSDERKRCIISCLQTKKKTSFSRTKLSSNFFWKNEETCETHIKRKIDAKFVKRWWRTCRILLTDERINCYCCLFKMNGKFSLLYRKSLSFIYLLIFHFLIHRDLFENRDLRLSRKFFLLIKLSSFFVVISIWFHQNRIFIFELIDLSTISKINKSERNHFDWMTVERLDAKSTNWWRIDDTNRLK
jgi:hypothetical protein